MGAAGGFAAKSRRQAVDSFLKFTRNEGHGQRPSGAPTLSGSTRRSSCLAGLAPRGAGDSRAPFNAYKAHQCTFKKLKIYTRRPVIPISLTWATWSLTEVQHAEAGASGLEWTTVVLQGRSEITAHTLNHHHQAAADPWLVDSSPGWCARLCDSTFPLPSHPSCNNSTS